MENNKHIIICVGRQLGSGGHDIARMLATDFNAKYYDRELLNLAAKESGFSEKFFEENDEQKGFFKSLFNMQIPHLGSGSMYRSDFSQENLAGLDVSALTDTLGKDDYLFSLEVTDGMNRALSAYNGGKNLKNYTLYEIQKKAGKITLTEVKK